jgi:hypothetical protein
MQCALVLALTYVIVLVLDVPVEAVIQRVQIGVAKVPETAGRVGLFKLFALQNRRNKLSKNSLEFFFSTKKKCVTSRS